MLGAVVLCATLACLALTGCSGQGGSAASSAEASDFELNIVRNTNNTTTVFTLDPAVQYQGGASIDLGVCETLFELNDNESDVIGVLATGYTLSDDQLTWTIDIRDGVQFSSGRALDAQVVKESLEYELAALPRLATMMDVEDIQADGQTLTITTSNVVPTLPKILTDTNLLIFDTNEASDLSTHIVGTGAYILEHVSGDGNCDLVRNDAYWRGTPKAKAIHSKAGIDASAVTTALQSGEIDWGTVQSTDVSLFEGDTPYTEYSSNDNGRVYYLYLNPDQTFTADPAVRDALAYTFDRDAILKGIYDDNGTAAYTIFPEGTSYYDGSHAQPARDLDKAKQILADAGYADTDGDGFLDKDGQKLELNITCYSANQFQAFSEALQAQLKEAGIDSSITVSGAIMDDLGKGTFNIGTYAYNTLTYGDALNYLEPVYETGGNSNFIGYSDPQVDELLNELKSCTDPTKRIDLARQVQNKVEDSGYYLYLIHPTSTTIVSSSITSDEQVFGTSKTLGLHLWEIGKTK